MSNGGDSFQQARQGSPGFGGSVPSPEEEEEQQDADDDQQGDDSTGARQPSPGFEGPAPGSPDTGDQEPTSEPQQPTDDDQSTGAQPTSPGYDDPAPSPGTDEPADDGDGGADDAGGDGGGGDGGATGARQTSPGFEGPAAGSPDTTEPETTPVGGEPGDVTAGDPVAGGEQAAREDVGATGEPQRSFTPEEARAEQRGVESVTPSPSRATQREQRVASGPGPRVETTDYDIELTTPRERVAERISERTGADIGPEDIQPQLTGPSGTPVDQLTAQQQRSIAEAGGSIVPTISLTDEAQESIVEARREAAAPEMGPRLAGSEGVSLGSGGTPTALVPESERRELVSEATTTGGFLGPGNEEAVEGWARGYSETFREFFRSDPLVEGQVDQPQDRFLESAAQTAVELGNVPGYVSGAEDVANVATGAPTITRYPGTTGELAGETAAAGFQSAAQFAGEQPLRATGILGGIAVTGGASVAGASSRGVRGTAQAARAAARGDTDLPSRRQLARTAGREVADELDPRVTPFGDFRGAGSALARRGGRRLYEETTGTSRGMAQIPTGIRSRQRTEVDTGDGDDLVEIAERRIEPGRDPRGPPPSVADPSERATRLGQQTSIPPGALRRQRSSVRSSFADSDADVLGTSFVPGFRAFEVGGAAAGQRLAQAEEPSVDTIQQQRRRQRIEPWSDSDVDQRVTPFEDTDVDARARQDQDVDVTQRIRPDIDLDTRTEQEQEARDRLSRLGRSEGDRRDRDRDRDLDDDSAVESALGGLGSERERFAFEGLFNPLGE